MPTMTIDQALQLAMRHQQAGCLAQAQEVCHQVLARFPDDAATLHLLAIVTGQTGRIDQALPLIERAVALVPGDPLFRLNHGRILILAGRLEQAARSFEEAIRLAPGDVAGHMALGEALQQMGDEARAAQAFQRVVQLVPDQVDAWNNLGVIHERRGELQEAEHCYRQAASKVVASPEALSNLGRVLGTMGRYEQAVDCHQQALRIKPDHPGIWFNLAEASGSLGRADDAIAAYQRALALKPDYVEALNNLGNVHKLAGRLDEAHACYSEALRHRADLQQVHSNQADAYFLQCMHAEAQALYRRALELNAADRLAHSALVYSLQYDPALSPADILAEARLWNERFGEPLRRRVKAHDNERSPDRRMRVGFVSPDFYDHCQSFFTLPLLEHRDRQRMEFFAYSAVESADACTQRLRGLFDHWRDIRRIGDEQAAEMIRGDRIDILVDLAMHMSTNRLPVFGYKPAPVQAAWLAYPGTTGLWAMDCRLTDPYLDPPEAGLDGRYSERSIRLPDTFWCYDPWHIEPLPNDLPALRNGHITFGCLNNFCKVNAGVIALWSRVLHAVADSRMIILSHQGSHRARTLETFNRHGIDSRRIAFVPNRKRAEYLAYNHQVDIGLDTFPYNGHTTSLDSYWMGVPVITRVGSTVVGRAGLSQLTNLGLTDLIASTDDQYVAIAASLAGDIPRLRALRQTLRERMRQSPLMDGPRFARGMEAVLRQLWRAWCTDPAGGHPLQESRS